MTIIQRATELRRSIDKASVYLSDAQASTAIALYPTLACDDVQTAETALVRAGTRINWNGQLKRAAVDLWDCKANCPDNAPALWEDINYKDGFRVIPDTITPGLAFYKNEVGWWADALYESTIDNNVWTPEQAPSLWEVYDA